jgi:hypothetical protein
MPMQRMSDIGSSRVFRYFGESYWSVVVGG